MTPRSSGEHTHPSGAEHGNPAIPVRRRASWLPLVASGVAGAVTVTLLNESVRQVVRHAPRMEVIGERALVAVVRAAGAEPPQGKALYRWTMAADLLSNALYYSLVAAGTQQGVWKRGSALGLAAGLGAVFLPRPMGLGEQPDERKPLTPVLTATWYFAGGLAAAAVYSRVSGDSRSVSDASG